MKYTVQTSKYVLKNLFYILPFALIPAFFLSMSLAEEEIIQVLRAVVEGDFSKWTFVNLFRAISVLNFGSWESVITGGVGLIAMVPCVALLMAFLDKHLRFGKRTFNGLWSKLNDNFISTFGYIVLFLAIYEVWSLLLAALLFFVSRITITAVAYVLAAAVFVAMHVVLLVSIGTIYLWLPCMQITGFRAFEALLYSYQLINPIRWRITFAQIFVLFVAESLICACAVYVPTVIAFRIVAAVLYAGILMIFCVRMQIAYFDRDNIERADTAKYYHR
jgi:hypothetical protein